MDKQCQRQEVGYILLEECAVLVPANSLHLCPGAAVAPPGTTSSSPMLGPPTPITTPVWHALDLRPAPNLTNDPVCGSEWDSGRDLVLRPIVTNDAESSTSHIWRSAASITPFNGMLSEIAIADPTVVSNENSSGSGHHRSIDTDGSAAVSKKRKRRSDASLLAGLAVEINEQADLYDGELPSTSEGSSAELGGRDNLHLRDLRMENAQIMFWDPEAKAESSAHALNIGKRPETFFTKTKASLLMTFSRPVTDENNITEHGAERNQRSMNRNTVKSKRKHKVLSSAHQLLGSIVRCDWDHLAVELERLCRQKSARNNASSHGEGDEDSSRNPFFPDSLKVEELYERIRGASPHLGPGRQEQPCSTPRGLSESESERTSPDGESSHSSTAPVEFLDLPKDILATSIATYLRACSLHALRSTARGLHGALRAVVPGLRLTLFHHQIRSLEWMERRECRSLTEEDVVRGRGDVREGEAACGGDYHRAVTGGACVLLRARSHGKEGNARRSLRFDAGSGKAMAFSSEGASRRKTRCARGGLLCDDPGLGKTITILSLILRTFGLSTEAAVCVDTAVLDDDALFYAYWYSSFLMAHERKPSILQLVTRLIKSDCESGWFVPPMEEFIEDCPDYFDVIATPISLQQIRNKYDKSDCRDFRAFEADVRMCFTNAMTYNLPNHPVFQAAERLSKNFEGIVSGFKSQQLNIASKSMSRMAKDPEASSLVDLFEAKKRAQLQEPLVNSSSTLLVVPNTLLLHWEEQLLLHIDFSYLQLTTDLQTPIYYHSSKRNITNPSNNVTFDLNSATDRLILIDDGSKALPPPDVLASFSLVLTSYNRFTNEWKNGSVEQEMRASQKNGAGSYTYWGSDDNPEASPLLKVSWLRVVVDEGHVMGKSTNNLIQFASWLTAQRHWAMTGTPTQQIATQNGLRNLYHLANFLNHEFFSRKRGGERAWNRLINEGWKGGHVSSFFRLKHVVSYLMVRHTKSDMIEIPPPIHNTAFINLSQAESTTYNTIVSGIRTNIITTSMEGKTSGWQDSLLNPRQSKFAAEALTNLRIACCGGTQIVPQILNTHWVETLDILREIHGLDEISVQIVNNFISRARNNELSSCHNCGIQLQILLVVPCGHLLCSECMNNKTTACPLCQKHFDVDDFQRLQPGLTLEFNKNLLNEKRERERQHALRRVLADSTRPPDVVNIDELADIGAANVPARRSHKKGESCVYSSRNCDGKCLICHEEHFDCNFMQSEDQQCSICFKFAEKCPAYASKSKFVIDKLLKLRNNDFADVGTRRCNVSPMALRLFAKSGRNPSIHRPLKAIVFSQFRPIYEYFGDRLIRRFGGACIADYSYARGRDQELHRFIHQSDCFVMLLSKQGSVGLDLSFVTHIFFLGKLLLSVHLSSSDTLDLVYIVIPAPLDTIYDKSLEAQVVARAYRMGATGPVFVEQLAAKDSVEEVMNKMNIGCQVVSAPTVDQKEKHAKLHSLLKSATLIRPQHSQLKKRKTKEHLSEEQRDTNMTLKPTVKTIGVRFKNC